MCSRRSSAEPFAWCSTARHPRRPAWSRSLAEDGTVGWGECFGPAGAQRGYRARLPPDLVGKDALATSGTGMHLYNRFRDQGQKGLVMTALSGIDMALWDLKGKPLRRAGPRADGRALRSEVRAYATGTYRLRHGDPLDYIVREVEGYARKASRPSSSRSVSASTRTNG